MIFTYEELKRMIDFSEEHNKENIYVKSIPTGIATFYMIQTQKDLLAEKDNLIDITDIYSC